MFASNHSSTADQLKLIQSGIFACATAGAFIVTLPVGLLSEMPQKFAWGLLVGIFTQAVARIGEKHMSPGLVRSLSQSFIAGLLSALLILFIASLTFANLSPKGELFSRALSLSMIQEPFLIAMWTVAGSYLRTNRLPIPWILFGLLCMFLLLLSILLTFAIRIGIN